MILRLLILSISLLIATSGSTAGADNRAESADGEVAGRFYEVGRLEPSPIGRRLPSAEPTARPTVPLSAVTEEQIASQLRQAGSARAAELAAVTRAPAASRLVPEDLSRRARIYHMGVENYTDAALTEFAARVGDVEGFAVVARVAPGSVWIERLRAVQNVTVTELPGVQYVWTEDVAEIGVDGTFSMTARMDDRGFLLRRSLFVDRVRRYYPQLTPAALDALEKLAPGSDTRPGIFPEEVLRRFPDIMFMNQGLVEADHAQPVTAAISQARGARMREDLMYLEGGNILLGTLPSGEPYAVVGRDSAAIARALLERHSGRPAGEADIRMAMAKDLGVEPSRVFLVEQPGVFHIDMSMTLLKPGTVLLNDAMAALRLQTQWLREDYEAWRPRRKAATSEKEYRRELDRWREAGQALEDTIQRLRKYAERFARFEARTRADLEAAGLTVVAMPGRFLHPTRPWDRDVMNFLNGESGVNPQGKTYFITQGGDPRAERSIAAKLLAPAIGLDRVYFAPGLASRDSLWEKGGIGCRIKVEGDVVAVPWRESR